MCDQPQPPQESVQHRVLANPRRLRLPAPVTRRPDAEDSSERPVR